MPKPIRRSGRRSAPGERRRPPANRGIGRRRNGAISRQVRDPRPLLERILETPHLAHVVPRLAPEVLHRVIERCGLEDCGEIVALATADQLGRVFDLDLWSSNQPGLDEQFNAERFGVWLEVLLEAGADTAAATLAGMEVNLVISAIAQHVSVFDPATKPSSTPTDQDDAAIPDAEDLEAAMQGHVGGYLIVGTHPGAWDPIIGVLIALDAQHREFFHRVMHGCRRLSNSGFELDGLDDLLNDQDQDMFDLSVGRERRRESQGYATPAQARAFLRLSRQLPLGRHTAPPADPVSRAYFLAIGSPAALEDSSALPQLTAAVDAPLTPQQSADAIASLVRALIDEGVLPQQPRGLLDGTAGQPPRLARIHAQLQAARHRDPAAYAMRSQELPYLANTIVAGCSVQGRSFTTQEASDAAIAVCNLGLANWPSHWLTPEERSNAATISGGTPLPGDFLVAHDLVSVFQVGWTVLYEEVSMSTAGRLIGVLKRLRCDDAETRNGLHALRVRLNTQWQAGTPWLARDAMDVLAILDMPAWAALLGLIDECPVMHAAIDASRRARTHAVDASAFAFISENSQIASIRDFMQSLPETLRG